MKTTVMKLRKKKKRRAKKARKVKVLQKKMKLLTTECSFVLAGTIQTRDKFGS